MKRFVYGLMLCGLVFGLSGCGDGTGVNARSRDAGDEETKVSPEEQKYLAAGRPFAEAIAARNYEQAFSCLSSHIRANMSPSMFVPPDDENQARRNDFNAVKNARKEDFASWMAKVESEHGLPSAVRQLHVHSTDPTVLSGRGDALDTMFAIGMMSKSVPTEIRRASLRCQIATKLTSAQLKEAAQAHGMSEAELQKNPDFQPYFNLKFVLVEEEGTLRVAHFEFMPPSMFD